MSAFILTALVLVGGDTSAASARTPDLSGRWVFNAEQSDDAREKLRGAMGRPGGSGGPRGGGPGGMGGGGGMGRPGGGMGGGGGQRPPRGGDAAGGGDDRRAAMRAAFEAASELTITHTAREIAILEKDGRLRALHPDGEKYADSSGAEVKTKWEKDRLVVRTAREGRPAVTETWWMAGEPAQIVVEMRFQPPGGEGVTIKRVYDRAPAK
jgi:hypothetical protein